MFRKAFKLDIRKNYVIQLFLLVALAFSSAHAALHDHAVGELSSHEECQVCRLNNLPVTTPDLFSVPEIHSVLLYLLPIAESNYLLSTSFQHHSARAPPVLN